MLVDVAVRLPKISSVSVPMPMTSKFVIDPFTIQTPFEHRAPGAGGGDVHVVPEPVVEEAAAPRVIEEAEEDEKEEEEVEEEVEVEDEDVAVGDVVGIGVAEAETL